jgi:recombination DNA repair RAD52 pathway protein
MNMDIQAYQRQQPEVYQPFTEEQEILLSQPLDMTLIKHRPGAGGRQLAYITAGTAIATANEIFGRGRWGYRLISRTLERAVDAHGEVVGLYYAVDIELYVAGAAFPFPGDGFCTVEPGKHGYTVEAHETARKGAVRDALKRALVHYGDSFGLCLSNEDAYVQGPDGVQMRVKEVPVNNKQQKQQRRMVDADQPATKAPVVLSLDAQVKQLKQRAVALGVAKNADEWLALLAHVKVSEMSTPCRSC